MTKEWVIGTSGHIDHGKTTLVKALTGVDTDRLAEEKRRGITIDLGFAVYEDPSGLRFSFVDVPGHEKFIHNMMAGAAGMDAVMLVVAADEGVMPQTKEHLQICQLLGVQHGIIALTRCDLVEDPDLIELCQEELRELAQHTFLEQAPMIPVSAVTGAGLPELKQAFKTLQQQLPQPQWQKPFRLHVDRSFSLQGFGTIVTGTVTSGRFSKEEVLWQYPEAQVLRVRELQTHGKVTSHIEAGERAAVNLSQIDKESIQRGHQIAAPHSLLTSYMLNVELQALSDNTRSLKQRERVRLYVGTQEVMGRLRLLEETELLPGQTQWVQLRLEHPVSSRYGDRFIIRQFSPLMTLGGGRIIDPQPIKYRHLQSELKVCLKQLSEGSVETRVEQVVYLQSVRGTSHEELRVRCDLEEESLEQSLQNLVQHKKVLRIASAPSHYLHMTHLQRIQKHITHFLNRAHQQFPERDGMTLAELRGKLPYLNQPQMALESILQHAIQTKVIQQAQHYYHLPQHRKQHSQHHSQALQQCIEVIEQHGDQPPRQTLLLEACQLDAKTGLAVLKYATHHKKLIRVSEDLYYTPSQLQSICDRLRAHFIEQSTLSVIEFKELLAIGRKHAVDLLEYFDSQHITQRQDNLRILKDNPEKKAQHVSTLYS